MDIAEEELHALYTWVDEIPLSRPKRNIARDFSDGVLCAEVVRHYFPNLVELHNYSPANSVSQKLYNWNTLNNKVFRKLGFTLPRTEMDSVCNCTPGAVERVLKLVKVKMAAYKSRKAARNGMNSTQSPTGSVSMGTPHGDAQSGMTKGAPASNHVPSASKAEEEWPSASATKGLSTSGQAQSAAAREIAELRETCAILETKVQKLEQLVRLKDSKIATLQAHLAQLEGR